MNVHFPAQRRWASRLAHLAIVIVVLALAAATFVLSYTGVHSIVLQAGVSARLARIYPGIFDAALVIACMATLMLREGRWWARAYAWLSIILVIAVVGAADAVHAMNVVLPHRKTAGVVAAAPWVLVLLGFSLWVTMLRQSRTQHSGQPYAGQPPQPPQPTPEAATLKAAALETAALEAAARRPAALEPPVPPSAAALPIPEGKRDDEETAVSGEAGAEIAGEHEPVAAPEPEPAQSTETPAEEAAPAPEPARMPEPAPDEEEPPLPFATVPRLRRVRSTPTPPEDGDEDQ